MRRPSVYRASSSASNAAAQTHKRASLPPPTPPPPLPPPQYTQYPHSTRPQTTTTTTTTSLSLIRLLAVVSVIGSQFHSALGTGTAATVEPPAASTTASSTQNSSTSTSTSSISSRRAENNNLFFDDHNTTKAISSAAVNPTEASTTLYQVQYQSQSQPQPQPQNQSPSPSASQPQSQSQSQSQMPTKATDTPHPPAAHFAVPTGRNPRPRTAAGAVVKTPDSSNEISHSAPIKNLITSLERTGTTDLLLPTTVAEAVPVSAAVATPKSARSTVKQPVDSTRSRNHWTVGGSTAHETERPRTFRSKHHHEHHWGPFFEEPISSVAAGESLVSAVHLFTEAVLNCRVGMLKDKTVMWVRRTTEKVSLLTVGNVTYSGDPRIRVKFQYPNNWRLLINPTQREDAGIYMCQVSTHPPRVFTTNLTVLEPPLRMIDEHERDVGDRYYKSGSTVDLQCQISRNFFQKERYNILKTSDPTTAKAVSKETENELNLIGDTNQTQLKLTSQELEKYFTKFITWAKDEEALQPLTNKRSSVSEKWLTSRITIEDAKLSDSGNYSCSLGRLFTVIVQVQVLTGELPAAVQHNVATSSKGFWCFLLMPIAFHFVLRRRHLGH
ncbi:uncharacterized protein LOC117591422 [Drosophila guanche]|uniref:Ig-like domain-containing protein n=1 Tax=Drosophila guanche TaxID=7266 RepID=A0A3B0L0H1_DROGU|nr:uncharacterized protein LOC117591422 [Drosophila guanche]XP_034140570.1 uncharacterized protein LOC117591422 [Drosophila guanche]SPP89888.1 Hypothetical predicted protein [Drosophila guanche]